MYIQWPGQMLDRELGALERRRGLKAWMLTTAFLRKCVTNRVTGGRTVFVSTPAGAMRVPTWSYYCQYPPWWQGEKLHAQEKDEACLAVPSRSFWGKCPGRMCMLFLSFIALTSSISSSHTQGPRLFKYIRSNSIRVIGLSLGVEPLEAVPLDCSFGFRKESNLSNMLSSSNAVCAGPALSSASSSTRFPVLLSYSIFTSARNTVASHHQSR